MASWMIHLRIADKLLDHIAGLSPIEFIMGNIAPDSGIPNGDGRTFTPSKMLTHFRSDNGKEIKQINVPAFRAAYFTAEQQNSYDNKAYSFYLGYLIHLITDQLWSDNIAVPTIQKFSDLYAADRDLFWEQVKKDWYDLDFLYLKKHPGFRAFRAYLGSVGFVNQYMDFFAPDAFDNRRVSITDFYLQGREGLEREYPYLTEAEANRFVEESCASILRNLQK